MTKLTGKALKQELWTTLQKLKTKKVNHQTANAVASQAREILGTMRVEMDILKSISKGLSKDIIEFVDTKK